MASITSNPADRQNPRLDSGPLEDAHLPRKSYRKLAKTSSWNLLAFLITCSVGWAITGSLITGGSIGLVCRLVKIPGYWLHESAYDQYWPGDVAAG